MKFTNKNIKKLAELAKECKIQRLQYKNKEGEVLDILLELSEDEVPERIAPLKTRARRIDRSANLSFNKYD